MCREDMAQHVEQNCPEKEVECPFAKYKCEVTSIKRKHLEQHLEEKETKHLGLKLNAMELKLNNVELKLIDTERVLREQQYTIDKLSKNRINFQM